MKASHFMLLWGAVYLAPHTGVAFALGAGLTAIFIGLWMMWRGR